MVVLILILGLIPLTIHAEKNSEELNLTWENSGGITFLVSSNQWFQFGIGINSTSLGSQDIIIEVIGETNWGKNNNIFEIKDENLSNQQSFELSANESIYINVKMFIPEIENGMPLAETEYPFQLKLSNSTGSMSFWDFAISIYPKYSLNIENIIENSDIEPSGTTTHEIRIKNTGNILTQFNSEISPLDSDGEIITTNESNRFIYEGWNASLSGWINALSLEPNESNVLKITINAPYVSIGKLSLLLHIESHIGGASEDIYLNTSINIIKKSKLTISDTNCDEIIFGDRCKLNLKITNLGNYKEVVQNSNCTSNSNFILLKTINSADDESLSNKIQLTIYNQTNIVLEPNEFINIEFEMIYNSGEKYVEAGTIGTISCNYYSNNLTEIESSEFNISVGTFFEITHDLIPINWIEENQLFLSMNLVNQGNLPESFAVSISVSHEGEHGLVLPENTTYDLNSTRVRSYEILELEPNNKFNITGWMDIPPPNIENETIWISINVYTHSNSFENTWMTNMTIVGIGLENNNNEIIKDNFNFLAITNLFNAYGYTLLALIIAVIILIKALKVRILRTDSIKDETKITNKDWRATFFLKKNNEVNVDSPSIDKKEFEQMFTEKIGMKKNVSTPMPEKHILEKASDTMNNIKRPEIDDLLDDLENDEEYDY